MREKAKQLNAELGSITKKEILAAVIVFGCILVMSLRSFIPALQPINKTAIILVSTILFFVVGILDVDDLEDIPLEYYPSLRRGHEHRVLPLGYGCRQVACR